MKLYILDGDSENTGVYNYIKNTDYKFETSETMQIVQQLFIIIVSNSELNILILQYEKE